MGIVIKQSFNNILIIFLAFAIGGVNAIFLYTRFLKEEYYGLVIYILSASNLLMPLTALGVQYSIIKFFSAYKDRIERDRFLTLSLLLPLFIVIPVGYFWNIIHSWIIARIPQENQIIEDYTIYIYLVAIACAYFEIFYSWSRVQLKSVFGNVLKELWNRVVAMLLLFAVFFEFITKEEFIYYYTGFYFLRMLLMMLYAFSKYLPKFSFRLPENWKEILNYTGYIVLAGSAGAMILDIDKVMIPGKRELAQAAYYTVAVFIGSTVEAPGRAMFQILNPLVAKALNENDSNEVKNLYKKSSINLLAICGLFFLLINVNILQLYTVLPEKYSGGVFVVLMISAMKLFSMAAGSNQAIISNSKYYRITLPLGLGMAFSVYYLNDILINNIGIIGAALSTLIVVIVFTIIKVLFIQKKLNIHPFSNKTWQMLLIILALFFPFYFWNLSIPSITLFDLPVAPIISIILKSILLTIIYLFLVVKLNISEQLTGIVNRYLKF